MNESRHVVQLFCCMALMLLSACRSSPTDVNAAPKGWSDRLLGTVGLQKLNSDSQLERKPETNHHIDLTILAGDNLNAGNGSRPLSVVMHLYQLRDGAGLDALTFGDVKTAESVKQILGDKLIGMREFVLIPGQQLHLKEALPQEAGALAIIALFHSPAKDRWKFVFDTAAAAQSGITMGVHACAMTASRGTPLRGDGWRDDAALARTRCSRE